MKYYITNPFNGFYNLDVNGINPNAIFITDEQWADFLDGINGQGIYLNNPQQIIFNNNVPSLTPYVVNQEEIHQQLINQAQSLFNQYNYTPYQWNKLTKPKQAQLTTYLDALSAIIDGTDITSVELPVAPF